jgi:hypothetical protein
MYISQKSKKRLFALISFCITIFGFLWLGAAFTAPYSAWWNSLNTGIAIFVVALIFAILSFPNFFAYVITVFSSLLLLGMLLLKFASIASD